MISAYPAFEELFLETYSRLTVTDRDALDESLKSIALLRKHKTPLPRLRVSAHGTEKSNALDLEVDALEQPLYERIRQAMRRA